MRTPMRSVLVVVLLTAAAEPALAAREVRQTADARRAVAAEPAVAARVREVRRAPDDRRVVVVERGFPLHRRMHVVSVRSSRRAIVVAPRVFLATVVWRPAVIVMPPPQRLVWEDRETLYREEGWTDFTLDVGDRGSRLFLELQGRAQLDFATVVFGNGEARVVDFNNGVRGSGLYSLLDFRDGRRVEYVRVVARAQSPQARIVLRMER